MDNIKVKDLVSFVGTNFYYVQTTWTISKVVSYLVKHNIPACPVTHSELKDEVVGRIRGYAILNSLTSKLKVYGERKIGEVMESSKWEVSDDQYLVDKISALYRKPVFAITNSRNKYYATIFQKDVAGYLHHISSRFMFLREIEIKLTGFIYSLNQDESVYNLQLMDKIELLFSDEIWNRAKIEFDKDMLKKILVECCQIRNKYFHYHDSNVDVKILKKSWNIIKRELFYIPSKEAEPEEIPFYDESLKEHPEIVKHLLKKNSKMTKEEAKIEAKRIWENYCEQNKERDEKREVKHQRRFNEALKWESYNTLFEHADNYGSDD